MQINVKCPIVEKNLHSNPTYTPKKYQMGSKKEEKEGGRHEIFSAPPTNKRQRRVGPHASTYVNEGRESVLGGRKRKRRKPVLVNSNRAGGGGTLCLILRTVNARLPGEQLPHSFQQKNRGQMRTNRSLGRGKAA